MTVQEIKKAIDGTNYDFYGIRMDDGIRYNIGEIANSSHQLFQDPEYLDEEMTKLAYPYMDDGPYAGFYDAGELNGTCVIKFDPEDDESIRRALDMVNVYYGNNIHVLAGDSMEYGNDMGEIIIADAVVLLNGRN